MQISYKKLWKLLIDRDMLKKDLATKAEISSTSVAKLSKNENVQFENLEFDMGKMKELGCEYLFSAGEILDADEMGLELLGYYETEKSHWGVWLYQLKDNFM